MNLHKSLKYDQILVQEGVSKEYPTMNYSQVPRQTPTISTVTIRIILLPPKLMAFNIELLVREKHTFIHYNAIQFQLCV